MPTEEFYAGQSNYIRKLNDLWDRATTSVFGTSSDSLSLTTGSKTFTTNTNLQFAIGSQVTITATADLSKYMSGQVTAYTQSTGAITVNVGSVNGSGTFSSWSITLSGAAGATGAAGIADNLSIGTVTSGGTAAASITGTSPNKFLNLTLQTGATGAAGAPNVLSIGSVTSGVTADATITGTSPSQTLNLVLPKGDTGDTGATGAKGLNARGAWSAPTVYSVDDWVTYLGSSYYRKVAGTSATDPATDTVNWGILASKGADGTGAVSNVTASSPLSSSGGATPNITIQVANTSQNGYLSSTDWNTFNGKQNAIGYTPLNKAGDTITGNLTFLSDNPIMAFIESDQVSGAGRFRWLAFNNVFYLQKNTATAGDFSTAAQIITVDTSGNLLVQTPATSSNDTKAASTAYVVSRIAQDSPSKTGLGATGSWSINITGTASNVSGVVSGANGGTGVDNTGKTITLGGNLTTSGAFASTFTMTGATTVTFPTSGTLLSTSSVVTVPQGGTGLNTLTAGSVLVGNGTSSPTQVAPSTAGNVLTSNGTTWVSSPPSGGGGGLVRLTGSSFSTQASVAYTTVFNNASYDTFLIVIDITDMSATSVALLGKFYNSSGTLIGAGYYSAVNRRDTYTAANDTTARNSAADFSFGTNGRRAVYELTVAPKKETNKLYSWDGVSTSNSEGDYRESYGWGGLFSADTVYGIQISAASGTFSGSIQIYGYAKS